MGSTPRRSGGFGRRSTSFFEFCEVFGPCTVGAMFSLCSAVEWRSSRTAAATATLSESTPGAMAIRTSESQVRDATSPRPSNSLPITSATAVDRGREVDFGRRPSMLAPIRRNPCAVPRRVRSSAQFVLRANGNPQGVADRDPQRLPVERVVAVRTQQHPVHAECGGDAKEHADVVDVPNRLADQDRRRPVRMGNDLVHRSDHRGPRGRRWRGRPGGSGSRRSTRGAPSARPAPRPRERRAPRASVRATNAFLRRPGSSTNHARDGSSIASTTSGCSPMKTPGRRVGAAPIPGHEGPGSPPAVDLRRARMAVDRSCQGASSVVRTPSATPTAEVRTGSSRGTLERMDRRTRIRARGSPPLGRRRRGGRTHPSVHGHREPGRSQSPRTTASARLLQHTIDLSGPRLRGRGPGSGGCGGHARDARRR